jgi:hypothetical protein
MGGRYLLDVELSREEIAKLFYATHYGDIVDTFRKLLEDEERQEKEKEEREEAARIQARIEQIRRMNAEAERRALLKQVEEKLTSRKKQEASTAGEGSS